jgi:hypothetical protein
MQQQPSVLKLLESSLEASEAEQTVSAYANRYQFHVACWQHTCAGYLFQKGLHPPYVVEDQAQISQA